MSLPGVPTSASVAPTQNATGDDAIALKGDLLRIPGSLATRLSEAARPIVLQGTATAQSADGTVNIRTQVGDLLFKTLAQVLPDKPVTLQIPGQAGTTAAALQRAPIPAGLLVQAQNLSAPPPAGALATPPGGSTLPTGSGLGTSLTAGVAGQGSPGQAAASQIAAGHGAVGRIGAAATGSGIAPQPTPSPPVAPGAPTASTPTAGVKPAVPLAAFAVQALSQGGQEIQTLLSEAARAGGIGNQGSVAGLTGRGTEAGAGRPLAFQPAVPSGPGGPLSVGQMLAQALDELGRADPALARTMASRIPQPGPQLAAQMLNVMVATQTGDIRALIGEQAFRALEQAGRSDLLRGLSDEFAGGGARESPAPPGDWRSLPLPFLLGQEAGRLMIHFENRDPNRPGGTDDDRQRFVIDLDMTRLGPLQLEGLYKDRRLDLVVRTTAALPSEARKELAGRYATALEDTRLNGRLEFVVGAHEHWLRVAAKQ